MSQRWWVAGGLMTLLFAGPIGSVAAFPWQGFTALALAPDGRVLATGGRQGEVIVWEAGTGEPTTRWQLEDSSPVVALGFSADSSLLGMVSLRGSFAVVDLNQGSLRVEPSVPRSWTVLTEAKNQWLNNYPIAQGLRITRGNLWVRGSPTGELSVGTGTNGPILVSWSGHAAAVTGLALSADGRILFSCAYDGSLARWDARTGQLLGRL